MDQEFIDMHDWFAIRTEAGDIYVFVSYDNAVRLRDWYFKEFGEYATILAGMDGQTID